MYFHLLNSLACHESSAILLLVKREAKMKQEILGFYQFAEMAMDKDSPEMQSFREHIERRYFSIYSSNVIRRQSGIPVTMDQVHDMLRRYADELAYQDYNSVFSNENTIKQIRAVNALLEFLWELSRENTKVQFLL